MPQNHVVDFPRPLGSVEILETLTVSVHVDGPSLDEWKALARRSYVKGATFNPSLCRNLGVTDYEKFCRDVIEVSQGKPVSLEVLADDFHEMKRQAVKLASWGDNVVVKIPITNTKNVYSLNLIEELSRLGIKVNVTAVTTAKQVAYVDGLRDKPYILSVFAGRISDAGGDAIEAMRSYAKVLDGKPLLLWASTREVGNIFQAEMAQCDIITVPLPILAKALVKAGCDLGTESLELVKKFHDDAVSAGFTL